MKTVALVDLEGVLYGEMWPLIASETGIEELAITTREVPDYASLMEQRVRILKLNGIRCEQLLSTLAKLEPLPGANEFLQALSSAAEVVIVTDSFAPMNTAALGTLSYDFLLTNRFVLDSSGFVEKCSYWHAGSGKIHAFSYLQSATRTVAIGDGFNDLDMLRQADCGVLFRPSEITQKHAQGLAVLTDYRDVLEQFGKVFHRGFHAPAEGPSSVSFLSDQRL